jgi:hypothetical protein
MSIPARRRLVIISISTVVLLILPAYLRAYTLSGPSDAPTLLLGDTAIVNEAG